MKITIKDIDINYIQYGSGEDIILLHGWGQNIEMMKPLGDKLQNNNRITILDFPGFGKSKEPKESLNIYEYCDVLEEFTKKLNIKKPTIIGHSFGGRVGIVYSSKNDINKLILFGSPCVRNEKDKPGLKVKMLKTAASIPGLGKIAKIAKKYIGSRDYKNASEVMRETLVKVVNEDLSECAKKIKAPTLLMWGEEDTEAPLEDAKKLEKLLEDAGLIVFPNSTHYAYLENLHQVTKIIKNFL